MNERAAKLITMLSSPNDGEVLNAARLLTKMGIHEIANIVRGTTRTNPEKPKPKPKQQRAPKHLIDVVAHEYLSFFGQEPDKDGYRSIGRFIVALGVDDVLDAMDKACRKMPDADAAFRYFCGICWNRIREQAEAA